MSLRARLALLTALAVAVAVVVVSAAAFFAARDRLRAEVDGFLVERTQFGGRAGLGELFGREVPRGPFRQLDVFSQLVTSDGRVVAPPNQEVRIPVDERDLEVADRGRRPVLRDASIDGEPYRKITSPAGDGVAVQMVRSLAETNSTLRSLGLILGVVSVAGVGAAAAAGLVIARRALEPVEELTSAAEHVARTQELAAPIEVDRSDEVGRLAAAFNAMLAALDESRRQQRRLVADASHELRTPLTSLRTNIEVLAKQEGMAEAERAALLADVTFELEELSVLVAELVDLATSDQLTAEEPESVRLDEIARTVVERARRRTGFEIQVRAEPTTIVGRPAALERAVSNLVDNACKWSPPGSTVEVTVAAGRVAVRDHGPGIDAGDRPFVFDRFYRAPAARAMPGSGLGLAIVRSVAEGHGGEVFATDADGGGAVVGFTLDSNASR